MRSRDLDRVADALAEPMKAFVREARVRTALLINHSGQVLARQGFTRGVDVASVATLAAAAHASAHALAELTESGRWLHLHHAGEEKQLLLAPFTAGVESMILVAIFDDESTLGLVQLFFDRLVDAIRELPALDAKLDESELEAFERDLAAGVDRLLSEPEID